MGNIFKLQKDKEYTKDKAKEIKAYHYGMGEKLPSKRLTYKIYNELIQFNSKKSVFLKMIRGYTGLHIRIYF